MRLLMVNDEVLTAETMKEEIPWEQYGIEQVYTAYDVEAGKECIRNNPVDIMLCDIEMPGENGLALLRWVRENKKDIECVFLTCHASFAYAREAICLGCQDYILIPAKYEEIGEVIQRVVQRPTKTREAARYQEDGNYKIYEICSAVGYNSSQYFSQAFYKKTGMFPTEYSKKGGRKNEK